MRRIHLVIALASFLCISNTTVSARQSGPSTGAVQRDTTAVAELTSAGYEPLRDGSSDFLIIRWTTNYLASAGHVSARFENDLGINIIAEGFFTIVKEPALNRSRTDQIGNTFVTRLPFGNGQSLSENTKLIEITVSADPQDASLRSGVTTHRFFVNPTSLGNYFRALTSLEKATQPVQSAQITAARVISRTDDTIVVEASSSSLLRAKAFAYPTDNRALATGDTAFVSGEQVLFDQDAPRQLTISNLSSNVAYIVVIRETSARPTGNAGSPARPAAETIVDLDESGKRLRTRERIERPTVAVKKVQNKRNDTIDFTVQTSNVKTLYVTVKELDSSFFEFRDVLSKQAVPAEPNRRDDYVRSVKVALSPGKRYKVYVEAEGDNPALGRSSASFSDSVLGLPAILFDTLILDLSSEKLTIRPTGVTESLKLTVSGSVTAGSTKLWSVTLPETGSSASPSVDFPIATIMAALRQSNPGQTAMPGTTPASTTTQIKFTLVATSSDDTERAQSSSFAIQLTGAVPDKKEKSGWRNVVSFGRSLVADDKSDSSLKASEVRGSGFGGFLGMLLRGFIGL